MYDSGRFFAFTGDVINNVPIQERIRNKTFMGKNL